MSECGVAAPLTGFATPASLKQACSVEAMRKRVLACGVMFFLFLSACSSSKPSGDADMVEGDVNPDTETVAVVEEETVVEEEVVENDLNPDDEELPRDDTAISDRDILYEECLQDPPGTEYIENTHTGNEECPDLTKANFPYYDTNGTPHFCRKCDKVWKKDPQCVHNLWKPWNCRLCLDKPEYDCCGYPCEMGHLVPLYYGDPEAFYPDVCDIQLDPAVPPWRTGMPTFKHFNLSEGKVGMFMEDTMLDLKKYPTDFKIFEFDLVNRTYTVRSMGFETLAYFKGSYVTTINDAVKYQDSIYQDYFIYFSKEGVPSVAYPKPTQHIAYTPALNEKWVFANIREVEASSYRMMYAKIGEWKWTSLGEGVGNEPQIVRDRLVFYTDQFKGYVCDLDKKPQRLNGCALINQGNDGAMNLVLDANNSEVLYYADAYKTKDSLIRVDLSKRPYEHQYIRMEGLIEPLMVIYPVFARGNLLLYNNNFYTNEANDAWDIRVCFYRVDEKKSYCSLPTPHEEGKPQYRQSASEFEGHWLVWQDSFSPLMKARDMECYCDHHPELCPFDDYIPQPDNPKDVRTGKRPSERRK